jgi:hypothetical protein
VVLRNVLLDRAVASRSLRLHENNGKKIFSQWPIKRATLRRKGRKGNLESKSLFGLKPKANPA